MSLEVELCLFPFVFLSSFILLPFLKVNFYNQVRVCLIDSHLLWRIDIFACLQKLFAMKCVYSMLVNADILRMSFWQGPDLAICCHLALFFYTPENTGKVQCKLFLLVVLLLLNCFCFVSKLDFVLYEHIIPTWVT